MHRQDNRIAETFIELDWLPLIILVLLVRAECVRQRNEVAIKLGIIFSLSLLSPVIC